MWQYAKTNIESRCVFKDVCIIALLKQPKPSCYVEIKNINIAIKDKTHLPT